MNWIIPALVKSSVGSSAGTSEEEGTSRCPLPWKYCEEASADLGGVHGGNISRPRAAIRSAWRAPPGRLPALPAPNTLAGPGSATSRRRLASRGRSPSCGRAWRPGPAAWPNDRSSGGHCAASAARCAGGRRPWPGGRAPGVPDPGPGRLAFPRSSGRTRRHRAGPAGRALQRRRDRLRPVTLAGQPAAQIHPGERPPLEGAEQRAEGALLVRQLPQPVEPVGGEGGAREHLRPPQGGGGHRAIRPAVDVDPHDPGLSGIRLDGRHHQRRGAIHPRRPPLSGMAATAPAVTPRSSRTLASISSISASLSFRKSLAFSRPCPIRWSP